MEKIKNKKLSLTDDIHKVYCEKSPVAAMNINFCKDIRLRKFGSSCDLEKEV